jgi:hypothetical protein
VRSRDINERTGNETASGKLTRRKTTPKLVIDNKVFYTAKSYELRLIIADGHDGLARIDAEAKTAREKKKVGYAIDGHFWEAAAGQALKRV